MRNYVLKNNQNIMLNSERFYLHCVDNMHSVNLSEGCQELKEKGYNWLFDVIASTITLPKLRHSNKFSFRFQKSNKTNFPEIVCRDESGKMLFCNLLPYRNHVTDIIVYVEDDNVMLNYEIL